MTLPLLGVAPLLGRLFTPEDDSPGTAETAILSHGYWHSRLGARGDVIGMTLEVHPEADHRFARTTHRRWLVDRLESWLADLPCS